MKTLIVALFLFIAGSLLGQTSPSVKIFPIYDTIIAGTDSIVVDTVGGKYPTLILEVTDTGSTYTDSIMVEVRKTFYTGDTTWYSVNVKDLKDTTSTNVISRIGRTGTWASANSTRVYQVMFPVVGFIRYRLLNNGAGYVAGRRPKITLIGSTMIFTY